MNNLIRPLAIIILVTGAFVPFLHADVSYQVTIDTTPLNSVQGYIAFDLFGGNPLQDNTATITSFATTGALGAGSTSGDVTGSLVPGPLVETADQFFNEWLQPITFASGLTTFGLDLTTNYAMGTAPDSFELSLLDSSFTPIPTSDSTNSSLFTIDLVGSATTPDVFTSSFATATVSPAGGVVPEPNLVPFACLSFVLMAGIRTFAKRRSARL
jgi:hypothetical protein